jgi:NAD(P)-dependent dehydrogenase (short-subunit alcohol dehydrogenase family)
VTNAQKTVIVAGVSRGIGAGLVKTFPSRGYEAVASALGALRLDRRPRRRRRLVEQRHQAEPDIGHTDPTFDVVVQEVCKLRFGASLVSVTSRPAGTPLKLTKRVSPLILAAGKECTRSAAARTPPALRLIHSDQKIRDSSAS